MYLPTEHETFSFALLENLAVGNPVVISNLPDVISAFGESESIYYAKLNNIKYYINGILKYYQIWNNNRDKYEELSKKAKKTANRFDSKVILPKIEEMFKKVYESLIIIFYYEDFIISSMVKIKRRGGKINL